MSVTIQTIHEDIIGLKREISDIKCILLEDFELSDYAKKALKQARETPESEYTTL